MLGTSSFGIFPGSQNVVIKGGLFNYIQTHHAASLAIPNGWERLFQAINLDAFYNLVGRREDAQGDASKHEEILGLAMEWAKNPQVTERILWVHGSSRASSISRSVANFQQDHGILATYFVNKETNNLYTLARFISTITYQLGCFFPRAREEIARTVAQDPAILSLSVNRQLHTLLIKPLSPFLSGSDGVPDAPPHPVLIIVHGCDYLDNYTQNCIVNALLRILNEFPLSVRILLSTKSSTMIPSLTPSIEDGLVTEMAISDERSLRANIIRIWNKLENLTRMRSRA